VVQFIETTVPHFGDETYPKTMRQLIKGEIRFEHLITGASENYRLRREEIASTAYGMQRRVVNTQKELI